MKENLLPALSTDDYESLKSSIARDGLKQPIVLDEETGDVVDGEHRQRACRELQIEPQYVKVRFASEHEKNRYALVVNLARRHLTREQKRELIANLRKSGWTQSEVAEVLGVTQKTISNQEQNVSNSNFTIAYIQSPDSQENADNGKGDAQVSNTYVEKFSAPDLRYKLTPKMRENIVARLDKGETQEQVAADYGVSRVRVTQIAKKKQKQQSRSQHREYIMSLEDIYKNVLHVPNLFYSILRNYISFQFQQIEYINKKKEYIKKYMYEIQAYRSRHKNFPVLTQKQFQNLYRLIKRNHYAVTVMSDVLSDILLDTSDAADWFKWLHEITEKYTLTSKAAQFEDKYLIKTVYSNRYAHYYEHKSRTAKEKKQGG